MAKKNNKLVATRFDINALQHKASFFCFPQLAAFSECFQLLTVQFQIKLEYRVASNRRRKMSKSYLWTGMLDASWLKFTFLTFLIS